ncbi:MAG: chromosomal replication initiator protein DnaA [Actinobacteria bacterium]|nr:chromosomal replication initiator protein DnaA [Actinomycetota bacterium]
MDSRDLGATAADDIWEQAAAVLRDRLEDGAWNTYFHGVRSFGFDGDRLTLGVPSTLVAERMRTAYVPLVSEVLAEVVGHKVDVDLVVDTAERDDELIRPPEPVRVPATDPGATDADRGIWASGKLIPRYTFDQFVIGANNRFAHAAALTVAEAPGRSYNPLFIYGVAGLGKTHLLHAVGHHVKTVYPTKRLRYVSTETFMNEFIDAIRSKTMPVFKRRYRDLDMLLMDDIQFLERTQELQEEFFHTFNQLHGDGGQIVISSDRAPKSMDTLEDRLRSRFEWGLSTDIQPPEFETRLAILRKKAEAEHFDAIRDDVLAFIATNITDNVRELEGALIRVAAFAKLNRASALSAEVAHQVLADLLPPEKPRVITPELILDETARMFGWTIEDLCGKSRRRPLVTARQIGMYVFRELTDYSYPRIAEQFGGRDHTTVMYAVDKIKKQMPERTAIFTQVNDLITRIKLGTSG